MKSSTLLRALLLVSALTIQVRAQNLISNGSFESGAFVKDTSETSSGSGSTLPGAGSGGSSPGLPGGSGDSGPAPGLPGAGSGAGDTPPLPGATPTAPAITIPNRMSLSNGSTTISNWVAGVGSGYVRWLATPDFNAQSGGLAVALGSFRAAPRSFIEQTMPSTVGRTYEVSAYFSSEGNGGPTLVSVLVNGTVIGAVTNGSGSGSLGPAYTNLVYTLASFRFQAASATSTIRFQDATTGNDLAPIVDNISVVLKTDAPVISSQPAGKTTISGGRASFGVTATGEAPLSYQWQLNGGALAGATNSVLQLASLTAAHTGNYSVRITNAGGVTTSTTAILSLVDVRWVSGRASLTIAGPNGSSYKIETANSLSTPTWSTMTTHFLAASPTTVLDPELNLGPTRFYRVTPLAP